MMDTAESAPTRSIKRSWWRRINNWWLHLTSSEWNRDVPLTPEGRETRRRSTLASWITLIIMVCDLVAFPITINDPRTLVAFLVILGGCVFAALLNRTGHISATAWLLTLGLIGGILWAITPEAGTPGVGADALPAYDLLAVPIMVFASLQRARSGFLIAAIAIVSSALDFTLQAHTNGLKQILAFYGGVVPGTLAMLARPVALQFMIAGIAYLWVRGVQRAVNRADLAEIDRARATQWASRSASQVEELNRFIQQVVAAHLALENNKRPQEIMPPADLGQYVANQVQLLNRSLDNAAKLKERSQSDAFLLVPALKHLHTVLQQAAAAAPGNNQEWYTLLGAFQTNVPLVDESAAYAFKTLCLQVEYAFNNQQGPSRQAV